LLARTAGGRDDAVEAEVFDDLAEVVGDVIDGGGGDCERPKSLHAASF